jgi:solute carrier family 25 oxoglutarate transporter 11
VTWFLAKAKERNEMSATAAPPKAKDLPMLYTLPISGASGMIAWLFAHPFELVKNRHMLSPEGTPLSKVVHNVYETGMFKGLTAGLWRQVVYGTLRLSLYDPIRDVVCRDTKNPSVLDRAAAGAISGAVASFCSSPIDVSLVLCTKSEKPLSVPSALKLILKESGVPGYFRGVGPLTSRAAVVGVCQVGAFDQSKASLKRYNAKNNMQWSESTIFCLASSFTSIFYSSVTMPIEFARVRMSSQLGKGQQKYRSLLQTIFLVTKEEGFFKMYFPFVPYCARCTAHTIIAFFILDSLKAAALKYV